MPETNTTAKKKGNPDDPGVLSVRIPSELRALLTESADANEESLGEYCRDLLEIAANNPDRKLTQLVRSLVICCAQVERAIADGTLNEHDGGGLLESLRGARELVEGPQQGQRESWWLR